MPMGTTSHQSTTPHSEVARLRILVTYADKTMTYYSSWSFRGNDIFVYNMKGRGYRFCPGISVTKRFKDVATGVYYLEIKFYVGKYVETVTIKRKLLAEKFLPELVDKGFSLAATAVNEVTLSEILLEQENSLPLGQCHTKLGYQKTKKGVYFFGSEEISGKLDSVYVGDQELSYSGAFCEWAAFVQQELTTNPLLTLPLAMGASAPVAARLKLVGKHDETMLFALIGASSTGKTTSLRLSASAWGRPSGHGIIDNLTGTEKYFFASLACKEGFPNFIDETSAVTWDFTKAIYTVALSREGGRCNPDGTPKKRKTWSGAVIFTGETSMFHRTNGNGGLHARLVELDLQWFADEKQPDRINYFVSNCYGTAWLQLMNYMTIITDTELSEKFDQAAEEIRKAIALRNGFEDDTWQNKKFTGIQIRIIKKLAILLLSADIMLAAWDMTVDRTQVIEHLLSVYDHNASRVDKIEEFRDAFVQYISKYRKEFPEVCSTGFDTSALCNAKGFVDRYKERSCVWVLASEFEAQLLQHGLDASPNVLRELHRRQIIERFGDRFKKNYKTGKIKPLCICFYPDSEPAPPKKTKHNPKKKSKQLKNLLADD